MSHDVNGPLELLWEAPSPHWPESHPVGLFLDQEESSLPSLTRQWFALLWPGRGFLLGGDAGREQSGQNSALGESEVGTDFFLKFAYSIPGAVSLPVHSTPGIKGGVSGNVSNTRNDMHTCKVLALIIHHQTHWRKAPHCHFISRTNYSASFQGHLLGSDVYRGSSKILEPQTLSGLVRKCPCSFKQERPSSWCRKSLSGRLLMMETRLHLPPPLRRTTRQSHLMNLHFMTEVIRMKPFKITKR